MEAIRAGREIDRVFIRKDMRGGLFQELMTILSKEKIPFQFVPEQKLNTYTRKNHQGIVALVSPIIYHKIEQLIPDLFESGLVPLVIILDGITDVRNLGAIARTAECAGSHALIIPYKRSAQINAMTVRTSAGALNRLPVCRTVNLSGVVKYLKNSGLKIFGATEKAEKLYFKADLSFPAGIVLGSEEKGISPGLTALCDELLRIPVYGQVSSLNVSVAASLLIYEVVRQRQF